MDTEYCDNCGLLHDPDDGQCLGCKLTAKIKKLKQLLLLTDDVVGGEIMGDLQRVQWVEYTKCFPCEAK